MKQAQRVRMIHETKCAKCRKPLKFGDDARVQQLIITKLYFCLKC